LLALREHQVMRNLVHTGVASDEEVPGHPIALAPGVVVAVTISAAALGAWRTTRALRLWLREESIEGGPGGSLIVGGSDVVVATAGFRRPRTFVSAGALLDLDDRELAAGLAHETGHQRPLHRLLTPLAIGLLGCARLLPGSRSAFRNLHFQLERDADAYALRSTSDPRGLAGAIAKAGQPSAPDVADRLRALLPPAGLDAAA
jgi:Zn-dependent protease with chaperone function